LERARYGCAILSVTERRHEQATANVLFKRADARKDCPFG
jgi:hypothetical protein